MKSVSSTFPPSQKADSVSTY